MVTTNIGVTRITGQKIPIKVTKIKCSPVGKKSSPAVGALPDIPLITKIKLTNTGKNKQIFTRAIYARVFV